MSTVQTPVVIIIMQMQMSQIGHLHILSPRDKTHMCASLIW